MELADLYKLFTEYRHITTDSRNVQKGSLFFALKGEKFDGNEFAVHALSDGAAYAIVDSASVAKKNERMIRVDNVLDTLQQLSLYHRKQLHIPVLAITGTNGKTTTKELAASVLGKKYRVFSTPGNLNNHIGVPLSILKIRPDHEFAVIEMGANHAGEIAILCSFALPDFGLITNLGKAHIEGFGSFQQVIKTKLELFQSVHQLGGTIFVNQEHDELITFAEKFSTKAVFFNREGSKGLRIINTTAGPYLHLTVDIHKKVYEIPTQLIGNYNVLNIIAALTLGMFFQVPCEEVIEAITAYKPQNNRSQLMQTEHNTLILDAYNANPDSMKAALTNFFALPGSNKVLILGDMLELGDIAEEEHKKMIRFLKGNSLQKIFMVGELFFRFGKDEAGIMVFQQVQQLAEYIRTNPLRNMFILLKGSRGIQLEKLIKNL